MMGDHALGEVSGPRFCAPGMQQAGRRWKWMPFGRLKLDRACRAANALGGAPWARANARENAASEP